MLKSVYTNLLINEVTLKSVWQQLITAVSRQSQDVAYGKFFIFSSVVWAHKVHEKPPTCL